MLIQKEQTTKKMKKVLNSMNSSVNKMALESSLVGKQSGKIVRRVRTQTDEYDSRYLEPL